VHTGLCSISLLHLVRQDRGVTINLRCSVVLALHWQVNVIKPEVFLAQCSAQQWRAVVW
jgi:hypothetical protein